MSDVHPSQGLTLDSDARCANDVTVDEAVHLRPSEVKGPSLAERALEEVQAVGATAKEAPRPPLPRR